MEEDAVLRHLYESKDPLQVFILFFRPLDSVSAEHSILDKMEAPVAVSAFYSLAVTFNKRVLVDVKRHTDVSIARV